MPQISDKYTTMYDKSITKRTQQCDIVPQKECFATICNILPHSVVFFTNYPTTNRSMLLQNIIFYHTMVYYTANSSVSITEVVFTI